VAEQIIEDSRKRLPNATPNPKPVCFALVSCASRCARSKTRTVQSAIQEQKILELTEGLFDDDTERQEESLRQITEAASIGPELFSNEIIDFLLEQSLMPEYGRHCLSICAQLALHRKDYADRFTALALEAIKREIYPELAAEILDANLDKSKLPLDAKIPRY